MGRIGAESSDRDAEVSTRSLMHPPPSHGELEVPNIGRGVRRSGSRLRSDRRAPRRETGSRWTNPRRTVLWVAYAFLGVLLAAYVVSLIVRRPDQQWPWLDGWLVAAFEVVGSLMCIARGLVKQPGRVVPLAMGFGLLAWAIGDVAMAAETVGGATAPTFSVADGFWICFYPLAYMGIVLLLRRSYGGLSRPNWLDGVVAGLGAAALCAAFAFHSIVHATGGGAGAALTNLVFPIGDLLLLALVVGGSALLSGDGRGPWLLLAVGVVMNVVGDTFALFMASSGGSQVAVAFNDLAWPTSTLLISMAVWVRPIRPNPLRTQRVAGFILPGLAAVCGLGILIFGTLSSVSRVALGLAVATLATVGVRLAISARSLRLLTEQNHRHAVTDELTGLGNRRQLFHVLNAFFDDPVMPGIAERKMAFLFVDLNNFKEINDLFGHPAGDDLLRQVGPRLIKAVRSSTDMVVRLGGDELAAVLLDADANDAAVVAKRIVEELEQPFMLRQTQARVGASIGITLAPADATDSAALLWAADVAMYRAKFGHAPFAFYDHDLDGDEGQPRLFEELREAVENDLFVLHYQPELNLRTGQMLTVEALIRWPHPRFGLIPPLKFIPLAEEAGLMGQLTALVLDKALAQCATWRVAGSPVVMAVNISATNLLEVGFTETVRNLLGRHRLPSEALILEITETSVITEFERSKAAIEGLRDLGVVVSIDDFGAGVTSLSHLSDLPVGELKLDRTFTADIATGGNGRSMDLVRATIELGHAVGLRVVAEGIEDAATLEALRTLDCDLAQGYYVGRPVPADKLVFRSDGLNAPTAALVI
jgi:diguanylate cyclase (GGDEF)-like protein